MLFISIKWQSAQNVWEIGMIASLTTCTLFIHCFGFRNSFTVVGSKVHTTLIYNRKNNNTHSFIFESQNLWNTPRIFYFKTF